MKLSSYGNTLLTMIKLYAFKVSWPQLCHMHRYSSEETAQLRIPFFHKILVSVHIGIVRTSTSAPWPADVSQEVIFKTITKDGEFTLSRNSRKLTGMKQWREALEKYLDNLPNDLTVPSWCNKKTNILAEISDLWREWPVWFNSAVIIFFRVQFRLRR